MPPDFFFCVDFLKKKSTEITQEACRTLNITVNRLLPALTTILFETFKETLWKIWILAFKRVGNIFVICCNHAFYHIHDIFKKIVYSIGLQFLWCALYIQFNPIAQFLSSLYKPCVSLCCLQNLCFKLINSTFCILVSQTIYLESSESLFVTYWSSFLCSTISKPVSVLSLMMNCV